MNKQMSWIWLLLVVGWLLVIPPAPAAACEMFLSPSGFAAKVGDTVAFKLERYTTHRQCVLPLEQTRITVTGGGVSNPGVWKKGSPDVLNFTVKFTKAGSALVRVERNCPKVGIMTVEARGTVSPAAAAGQEQTASAPDSAPVKAAEPASPAPTPAPTGEPDSRAAAPVLPAPSVATEKETEPAAGNQEQELPIEVLVPDLPAAAASETSGSEAAAGLLSSRHFQLWLIFIVGGLLLFLTRLSLLRKGFLFLGVVLLGFYLGACPGPVGAVYYLLLGNPLFRDLAIALLALPVLISLLWGRVFCGWSCPLGAVQEFMFGQRWAWRPSAAVDRGLKLIKYPLLLGLAYHLWRSGENLWGRYEPFRVLFNFDWQWLGVLLLAVTLAAAIVLERPFCRYVCPLGAILSLTSGPAWQRIEAADEKCKGCRQCGQGICPMGAITLSGSAAAANRPRVDNRECIRCLRCVEQCRFKALYVGRRGGK